MKMDERKRKTLILVQTDPDKDMMFKYWKMNGLNADIIFRPHNRGICFLRRLWANYFLPGYSLWYGSWKKNISEYDTVIIHADVRTRTVPRYIHKIKPSMRIIYWYWNPVNEASRPHLTRDENIECWSFDEKDCEIYNMKKNIQYYYEQTMQKSNNIEYDVYFVGHDKGRGERIAEIKKVLEEKGISGRFDLVKGLNQEILYGEVQERIRRANAILEVNQEGQVGCTLRALEALFYRKKLITTNANIIYEDFYNENNIFVYGVDDISRLRTFIRSPYDKSSDKFRSLHTIDAWFSNFFERS